MYSTEYYQAIKKKKKEEILSFGTTMGLGLSEKCQKVKDSYIGFTHLQNINNQRKQTGKAQQKLFLDST